MSTTTQNITFTLATYDAIRTAIQQRAPLSIVYATRGDVVKERVIVEPASHRETHGRGRADDPRNGRVRTSDAGRLCQTVRRECKSHSSGRTQEDMEAR
jgi:hypothetical protein